MWRLFGKKSYFIKQSSPKGTENDAHVFPDDFGEPPDTPLHPDPENESPAATQSQSHHDKTADS